MNKIICLCSRIEEAKQKTKEEFLKNIHHVLEGQSFNRKTWDIVCDLSAPQLIVPEHFVDKEALILVVDFGKFHLTNRTEDVVEEGEPVGGASFSSQTSARGMLNLTTTVFR